MRPTVRNRHHRTNLAAEARKGPMSARTVANTAAQTGAFTKVKVQEVFSQDQLSGTLTLTRAAQQFYEAPGKAAVETG
jgi:hypothetical protein